MNKHKQHNRLLLIDFIPAISGLIGKIALVSSFAFVWAQELGITYTDFIYLNVRLELIIASIITLITVFMFSDVSPPGTLAPLIVLIPIMARYGAHPLILSVLVGIFGIIFIRSGIFNKIYSLSLFQSKSALSLVFGISGIIMSAKELNLFFNNILPITIIIISLSIVYIILLRCKKLWLIIPISAIVSVVIAYAFGSSIDFNIENNSIVINPAYWWNDIWNIGYGLDWRTILITLPFALFVIILWTVDTLSITAIKEEYNTDLNINLSLSFYAISCRNLIGGVMGGAQTGSLWRSYLIPLYMTQRKMRSSTIILGISGLIIAILGYPIIALSYAPIIFSVLLFGIFLPLTVTGVRNLIKMDKKSILVVVIFSLLGIIYNPIITWVSIVIYEQIAKKLAANKL